MIVKKIQPKELPKLLTFYLNQIYETELGDFVVIADNKKKILYVNSNLSIPEEDINGFLEVIAFPDYWVNDDEMGKGILLEYIFNKYGCSAYRVLIDSHAWYIEQREKCKAEEIAKKIIPLIEKEVDNENPIVECDKKLIYEIWNAGHHRKTPKNSFDYGNVYEFYFGYLMGAGMLKEVL